jgi:hypothetical protein
MPLPRLIVPTKLFKLEQRFERNNYTIHIYSELAVSIHSGRLFTFRDLPLVFTQSKVRAQRGIFLFLLFVFHFSFFTQKGTPQYKCPFEPFYTVFNATNKSVALTLMRYSSRLTK